MRLIEDAEISCGGTRPKEGALVKLEGCLFPRDIANNEDCKSCFANERGRRLWSSPDDLWMRVMKSKYKSGMAGRLIIDKDRNGSNFWKGLVSCWSHIEKNIIWRLGNAPTARFWDDAWVPQVGKLSDICSQKDLPACFFVNWEGQWNTDIRDGFLQANVIDQIENIKPPMGSNGDDYVSPLTWPMKVC